MCRIFTQDLVKVSSMTTDDKINLLKDRNQVSVQAYLILVTDLLLPELI